MIACEAMKKNICICGGGGLGHTVSGYLSSKGFSVNVLSNRANLWSSELEIYDCKNRVIKGQLNIISDKPEDVIPNSDIIILCVPGYLIAETLEKIKCYLKKEAYVGSVVSSSGFFFIGQDVLPMGTKMFGFQRVPFISRVKEYGKSAILSGYRTQLFLAILNFENNGFNKMLEMMFDTPVRLLNHYLEAALTNSNPILHPSRLYSLFKNYEEGEVFASEPYFYEEWDDDSSKILLACDNEFQQLISHFNINKISTLLEHYESSDLFSLTTKIRSLKPLHGMKAPMKKVLNGYIPDFSDRYFMEDIPYGMLILKILVEHLNVQTPMIDNILLWAQKHLNEEYLYYDKLQLKVKKYIFDPYCFFENFL